MNIVLMAHTNKMKIVLIVQVHAKSVTVSTHAHNANLLMFCLKTNVFLTVQQELI